MAGLGGVSGEATRTLEMRVSNVGFMLERLGQDCGPTQYVRELTENSIQAIGRTPGGRGEVVWDVDWRRYEMDPGARKLMVVDQGVGMTGSEMARYVNMLSSSGREQSHVANFGVGAKIAAATRNRHGLVYLSWKDGIGWMIRVWRDPATGQYGLKQFAQPDGTYAHWVRVDDSLKPEKIGEHGTAVVLLGDGPGEDTVRAPGGARSPSRWVAYYLNTRYFRFPEGVVVRAREGSEYPREDTDRNVLRTVTGQEAFLRRHSVSSGSVDLGGAVARWWILGAEKAVAQRSGSYAATGHVAALFQDELYEATAGAASTARLQQFGVLFGFNRVVIYVEPEERPGRLVASNTARSHLLLGGEPLPWAEWAAAFRERMPEEVRRMMEEVTAGSNSEDHKRAIKNRIDQVRDLLRLSRYRRTPRGGTGVCGPVEETVVLGRREPPERVPGGASPGAAPPDRTGKDGAGGRPTDPYELFVVRNGVGGVNGEEVPDDPYPEVRWITAAEGTREAGQLEDRAARYLLETNTLLVNGDFRAFGDMTERWRMRYAGPSLSAAAVEETVREVVREWFEQSLVETVLGVRALRNSREWSDRDIEGALSEEALTAAAMQRYHVDHNVKWALGSRLGSLKERAS